MATTAAATTAAAAGTREVVLVSASQEEVRVTEDEARCSGVVASMLDGPFVEAETRRVKLDIATPALREVARYMKWKVRTRERLRAGMGRDEADTFVCDPALVIDVVKAARFLAC